RHYRLRVKLNSFDRILLMSQAHDQTISRSRRDFKRIGQIFLLDHQRVIPRRLEPIRQSPKDRRGIVAYLTRFAVHQIGRANYSASKRFANRLTPKAHTQYRHFSRELADHIERNPRVLRHARAGRDDYSLGFQIAYLLDRYCVVAIDPRLSPQLADVLNKVVSKRVVVVDYQNHCD